MYMVAVDKAHLNIAYIMNTFLASMQNSGAHHTVTGSGCTALVHKFYEC